MIAEFTVKNYRSFKEKQTFSLLATKSKELLETNTFKIDEKHRFLKSAVIYGANASGKSNFFHALVFFMNFSVWSGPHKQAGDNIDVDHFFFSKQTETGPSSFELVFFINNNEGKSVRYRYGFSVTDEEVITEYLFALYNVKETNLFKREKQNIVTTSHFREGSKIKSVVRPNCSFLSVCAQNNGEIATCIVQYFRQLRITSGEIDFDNSTRKMLRDSEGYAIEQIRNFLHFTDIQIRSLTVMREHHDINELLPGLPDSVKANPKLKQIESVGVFYGHDYYDNEKNIGIYPIHESQESRGTQKVFDYVAPVMFALKNGTPLFIDEFDTHLHPLILESIIGLFNSPYKNKKNAQLIISCHAVNIMTNKNFRRDQIWFCEKDQYGATDLYSLVEYDEPVRNDAAFGKNYLQGKYGAVPFINEIALQFKDTDNGT
ncbi:MAG: ATP-binding protein [Treponema sp.]|nr:ATP-binding protein [Treponema sp.]